MTPRRMTAQSVLELLARRAGRSRVARFSPHDLRRTFISDLLEAGADITTVASLAGRASDDDGALRSPRRGGRCTGNRSGSCVHQGRLRSTLPDTCRNPRPAGWTPPGRSPTARGASRLGPSFAFAPDRVDVLGTVFMADVGHKLARVRRER